MKCRLKPVNFPLPQPWTKKKTRRSSPKKERNHRMKTTKQFALTFVVLVFRTAIVAAVVGLSASTSCLGQPTITRQPVDFSVSLGANLTNTVSAGGASALSYQWRFNQTELTGATNRSLVLTNIQLAHAGDYSVVVSDSSGSVSTSRAAKLEIDPTFTKITTGQIVHRPQSFVSAAWGDFDGDGYLDLAAAAIQFAPTPFQAVHLSEQRSRAKRVYLYESHHRAHRHHSRERRGTGLG